MSVYFRKSLLTVYFLSVPYAQAQISEYSDCSEDYHDKSAFQRPLTQEEKAERLENVFYERLSSVTKCVDQESDGGAGGGGGAAGGSSAAGAGQSMSKNVLSKGEKSLGITGSKVQVPVVEKPSGDIEEQESTNGREHIELQEVDNKAALRAQIKAQADIETDPEIKAKLIEQYEALK
jgi:hypothetical protein